MKLNADLVYEELQARYSVKMMGPKKPELTISRPELYLDQEVEFQADHLYLATVEHLPLQPKVHPGAVVVVIGESMKLSRYREHCCLMVIRDRADFFEVDRVLCRLFDRYYDWEKQLFDIFLDTASLQAIVDCSAPIFRRPIHVLDAAFRYLAHSDAPTASASLEPELISQYLASFEMNMDRRGAMRLDMESAQYLCVNLFSAGGSYLGCVYMMDGGRPFSDGDMALAEFLGRMLEKAIEKNPSILTDERATIKQAVRNLLSGYPLTANQKWVLNLANHERRYLCVSLHMTSRLSRLPQNYLCSAFEAEFTDAFAFPQEDSIVCFLPTDPLMDKSGDYHAALNGKLRKFLAETRSIAGVSNSFSDLYQAKIALAQAEATIENGLIATPETKLFYFQSYALLCMIINSMGNLPAEAYFSERLQRLIAHDKDAPVSYLETLRVFLRTGQSYSRTAEELYIHRSTVVDRIERIERELEVDLKDPDTRLQLEIILRAMEFEEMVQQAKT